MLVQTFRYGAIEEYFSHQVDWEFEYLQLSPGALDFQTTLVSLPGVQLYWNTFGSRMRHRELYRGSTLMFGFVLDSDRALTYRGQEFRRDYAQVQQPNFEHEYVIAAGLRTLMIYVDTKLVDRMGWILDCGNVKTVPRASLRALAAECRRVTDSALAARVPEPDSAGMYRMRDRILVQLEAVLDPWRCMPGASVRDAMRGTREFEVVRRAEELFEQRGSRDVPSVDVLASELGVSRRKLYYYFRNTLNLGPAAYLEIVRLHRARQLLLNGKASGGTVTRVAYDLGFSHMGRFSASYRRHFGELPKDTLKRS